MFPAALQESDATFAKARGQNATIDVLNLVEVREVGEAWALTSWARMKRSAPRASAITTTRKYKRRLRMS